MQNRMDGHKTDGLVGAMESHPLLKLYPLLCEKSSLRDRHTNVFFSFEILK